MVDVDKGRSHPSSGASETTNEAIAPPRTAQIDEIALEEAKQQQIALYEDLIEEEEAGEEAWERANLNMLAEIEPGIEDLDLAHARIRTLRGFDQHFKRFSSTLKRLCLRQNLISSTIIPPLLNVSLPLPETHQNELSSPALSSSSLSSDEDCQGRSKGGRPSGTVVPFSSLENVEEIDLYDNRISKIQGLSGLPCLKSLDLSFNLIRKIENLDHLPKLRILYLVQNKISKIDNLQTLTETLESLELGSNRIRVIENMQTFTRLTELWLGKNKIVKLEGLDSLINLKILSIQSNRVVKLEGLDKLINLEEFYVGHNGLKCIGQGLKFNTKLRVLDIAGNMIESIEGMEHLSSLEECWANNNKIESKEFGKIIMALGPENMPKLETVYFEGNPFQNEFGVTYRRKLILALPQVHQIDATFVKGT